MNNRLKKIISKVIDESQTPVLTATTAANEAFAHADLPDHFNDMSYPEAIEILKPMAAEVLREKFENPASATPEHINALREYGKSKSWKTGHRS